jgi:hypothetical protein
VGARGGQPTAGNGKGRKKRDNDSSQTEEDSYCGPGPIQPSRRLPKAKENPAGVNPGSVMVAASPAWSRVKLKAQAKSEVLGERVLELVRLKDETILRFYENIRTQVEAERRLPHKFMAGDSLKQYAAKLREELTRRGCSITPIEWHPDNKHGGSEAIGDGQAGKR